MTASIARAAETPEARRFAADPAIVALTLLTAAAHLALAGRYDFMRNELYFLVCGWRPAFGYVDQPPLVPLIAAATQVLGENVWLLRVPAALAAIALVPVTASLARLVGGDRTSAILAAAGAALSPALAGLTTTTTTTTFEPIGWTVTAYFLARAIVVEDERSYLGAALVAGVAMEAKYGVAIWLIGLGAGLVATRARSAFTRPRFWLAALVGAGLAAPSLIWQQAHGWPFLEVIGHHGDAKTIFTGAPLAFAIQQVAANNIAMGPLWLAGVVAPFVVGRLAPARFLAIAFIVSATIVFAGGGKDYYLYPAYPTMFAVGAAAFAGLRPGVARVWLGFIAAVALILAPVALPILDPPALFAYLEATRLRPPPDEAAAVAVPLTQVFSEEQGWRDLERRVAAVYRALPDDEKPRATILASNYGEAAAIDVFGRVDGLPPAVSGQNQYYLWGPGPGGDRVIIHVNGDPERWRRLCRALQIADTFAAPYAAPFERDRPIMVCRGFRADLAATWPRFKRYQ
jgi:hypothetical protein